MSSALAIYRPVASRFATVAPISQVRDKRLNENLITKAQMSRRHTKKRKACNVCGAWTDHCCNGTDGCDSKQAGPEVSLSWPSFVCLRVLRVFVMSTVCDSFVLSKTAVGIEL